MRPRQPSLRPRGQAAAWIGRFYRKAGLDVVPCAGNRPTTVAIVERVLILKDLAPGEYVLSWRWDCEQTPQVWNSCADVTVGQ